MNAVIVLVSERMKKSLFFFTLVNHGLSVRFVGEGNVFQNMICMSYLTGGEDERFLLSDRKRIHVGHDFLSEFEQSGAS
ncbi:hypothetical protein CCP2SC5_1530006 [Azospirillaceae bacterium]